MNKLFKIITMAFFATALFSTSPARAQEYFMYVGTYTTWKDGGKGIYLYRFDSRNGKITYVDVTGGINNPSFLIAGPRGQYLYAVNELGNGRGEVSSFSIHRPGGALSLISTRETGGDDPCHLSLSPEGDALFTANYSGGNISVFPVEKGGRLQPHSAVIRHTGHGPDASRQQAPHPHEVVVAPGDDLLYVPDLGLDKIFLYQIHGSEKPLPATPSTVTTPPAGGPRHLAFSPDNKNMYVVLEMGSALVHFKRSGLKAPWEMREKVSLLPAGADATGNTGAELALTADGKYLYASNRGHNSISLFTLDRSGKPVMAGNWPCGGKTPRFFTLDPSGKFLLVLNQDSGNMVLFRRNKDGSLQPTGTDISVPRPVCAVFVPVK